MRDVDLEAGLWEGPLPRDLERLRVRASHLAVPPEPDWDVPRRGSPPARRALSPVAGLAMAAAFVAAFGFGWFLREGWRVEGVAGRPALSGVAFAGRVGIGGIVTTDAHSRARLELPGRNSLTIEPGGCIARVPAPAGECRLEIVRGTVRMNCGASAALVLLTREGGVVDARCSGSLAVNDRGEGRLDVAEGRAVLESGGRTSLLPAGFWCPIGEAGAGVPRHDRSNPAFLANVTAAESPACQVDDVAPLLASAGPHDAVTLWHLLPRVQKPVRRQVAERFAALVPVPADVSIDRVVALEPSALGAWWNAIGVGDLATWREARRASQPTR